MEQADTNLISSLASDSNLDTAWELRAVTAFAKAAPEHRAYIRGHSHKSKQVDLLNELMRGADAGPGPRYVDNSAIVAQAMIAAPAPHERSTPWPPTTAAGIRSFIEQPLGRRLPLYPTAYAKLSMDPACHRVMHLLEANDQTCSLSTELLASINSKRCGKSEMSLGIDVAGIIESTLRLLQVLTGLLPHRSDHNTSDTSGATCERLRPDFCLWVNETLVFKGEEKATIEQMSVAAQELAKKMGPVWSPIAFGDLPYLLCYVAASSQLQFYVLLKGQLHHPISITKRFDLSVVADRVEALHATVNLFRLLCTLQPLLPPYPVAVGDVLRRPNGTTITILTDGVVKKIKNFTINNKGVKFEDLANVYSATCNAPGLIHAKGGPVLNERSDTYKVTLAPLGHRRPPENEDELRQAIQAVLRGVAALHKAGYVHRDVRWDNVLGIGKGTWILADLESAAAAPARAAEGSFHAACWTGDTLDESGTYTTASDVQLVGQLMATCGFSALSAECMELQAQLMTSLAGSRPSAEEALSHRWFAANGV